MKRGVWVERVEPEPGRHCGVGVKRVEPGWMVLCATQAVWAIAYGGDGYRVYLCTRHFRQLARNAAKALYRTPGTSEYVRAAVTDALAKRRKR